MKTATDTIFRRTVAILAIALGSIALTGCSFLPGGSNNPGSSSSESSTEEEGDDVFSIRVGDCLNDANTDGEVSKVPIVACSEPHDSEAYDAGNVDDGDFPGDDAITQAAEELCGPSFEAFIGLGYEESLYDYSYYYPTEESWSNGDREVLCVAFADDASKITGSLKGTNS